MTLLISLTPDMERRLAELALREGRPEAEIVREAVERMLDLKSGIQEEAKTLAETLAGHTGTVDRRTVAFPVPVLRTPEKEAISEMIAAKHARRKPR